MQDNSDGAHTEKDPRRRTPQMGLPRGAKSGRAAPAHSVPRVRLGEHEEAQAVA